MGADGTHLSYNLFAYCKNNPANDRDDGGQLSWLSKIAIGAAAIAIGVGVTALTGGAALPALVAGVKAACVAGAISASISAVTTAVPSAVSGDSFATVVQKSAKAAVDGFADGFMAGGIAAGAAQVASGGFKIAAKLGVKTGRNGGIKIGKTKLLSPDAAWHKNNGGTLLKIGKTFRIDVGSHTLLHMHLPIVSSHIQIGTIGAGIYGGGKMRKTKVTCFRYHRYNDVYVSNVAFSINTLLSILDIFPDQKIIVLIESDANDVQTLSSVAKNIGLAEVMSLSNVSSFLMACSKKELLCLLNLVDMNDFEGMFIANISNDIIPYAPICSLARTASAMVKNGTSDVSIAINFPENQMVISLSKEKYAMTSIKDRIYNIFAN